MSRVAVARRFDALVDRLPGGRRMVLELRVRWLLTVTLMIANMSGAGIVLLFAGLVIPSPPEVEGDTFVILLNVALFGAYSLVAFSVAMFWGDRLIRPVYQIVRGDGEADESQRLAVIRAPARLTIMGGLLWLAGAVGWFGVNLYFSALLALKLGLTTLMGAITTCVLSYLLAEYLIRPAAALALAEGPRRLPRLPTVTTRAMLAWALGTAVPVIGLMSLAIAAIAVDGVDERDLVIGILGLGAAALFAGVIVTFIATRAIADPIRSVRRGMARVERGDLDTRIEVYDASELGRLQAGFNHMVAGLREHERLRDIFGRQVGRDVADLALEEGVSLGGEQREVAVLFVDITGSTRLAETRPPGEVVALLNAFFGVVVEAVNTHGGWINKFEGDAALAVFGAPVELDDPGGSALSAAREMAVRLREQVPDLDAGIGVSAGPVVAGYVGAEQRFEYTVIGDPVNEAARLCDLAKNTADRVLASAVALETAGPREAASWHLGETVAVRGRKRPTRLARPVPPAERSRRRHRLRVRMRPLA